MDWFGTELEWDCCEHVWVSYVRGLGDASTYGDSLAETISQTRDPILGYLEVARLEGIPVPQSGVDRL
jgi:predicted RNase H-like HicB family nuclease